VEKAGVFVLLMGNLGTHHTNVDAHAFRGFALADNVAPIVVINENDSRAAWSFTLLHELTHIWLGETGISGYGSEIPIERFCDAVAARFLLAPAELGQLGVNQVASLNELKTRIDEFAGARNLSRKMIAYNLLQLNLISAALYRRLSDTFDAERLAQEEEQDRGEGGPNYYVVRRHRIGPGLVGLVGRLLAGGALSIPKAGMVLGVKPTAVDSLVGGVVGSERAA
jgi:Zn-dependent peptidase ImmA (M78 family)